MFAMLADLFHASITSAATDHTSGGAPGRGQAEPVLI